MKTYDNNYKKVLTGLILCLALVTISIGFNAEKGNFLGFEVTELTQTANAQSGGCLYICWYKITEATGPDGQHKRKCDGCTSSDCYMPWADEFENQSKCYNPNSDPVEN